MQNKINPNLLTDEERKLQEIVKKIRSQGENNKLEREFTDAWKKAADKLAHDNPDKSDSEIWRILHYVCQVAR